VPPKGRRRKDVERLAAAGGFSVNPVAGAVFSGIILIVLIYSTLDATGTATWLGAWATLLPAIGGLMALIYLGLKRLRQRRKRIRTQGPFYFRHLMKNCLKRTCGSLEKMLDTPETASATIFNAILLDKMLWIGATDCLRYLDIRRQIEDSGLKGTNGLALNGFFQAVEVYREQELPAEIKQADELVARSRPALKDRMERLKSAHQALCTGTGDILALLPPDPKRAEKILGSYRFTPPTPEGARRIAFALETLAFLKAVRYKNTDSQDGQRYRAAADIGIPKLAGALRDYQQAWKDLVDAYEQPKM
jgi:hypothetical protein